MIGIIDYGMGNLRSVEKAFHFLGYDAFVSNDPTLIKNADKVILPGVGAFCDAIDTIRKNKFDILINEIVQDKKPLLGICLGMQLLFDKSYENGEYEGLGILEGVVKRLPDTEKVPHIGWNSLDIKKREPLFEGLKDESYVYFVHSYHLETTADIVSSTTFYGKDIQVSAQKDNVFALQFHPEKSGDIGLHILKNFGEI